MDDHEVDIISSLPDEILLHIISLLPFESVISTIFLSKRWSLLWNQQALTLHGDKEDIAGAVSSFLTSFYEQHPIKNTRKLHFRFDEGNVLSAIIAPNNILRLNFSSEENLKISRNDGWHLKLNSHDKSPTRQPVSSTLWVKSLYLVSVNHLTDEAVSSIFSNLHALENLKLVHCTGLTSLNVVSTAKLVHLTVFDCSGLQFLEIKSFKLKTFRYRGFFPLFRLEYHFNLTDAMFDARHGPSCSILRSLDFDPVLLTIKNAEILTLCKWVFEALICPSLSLFRADFQLYRLKELWWIDTSLNRENIGSLISFLKLCPSLERLFITIDPRSYSVDRTVACSKLVGEHTRLEKLKLIKLEGFTRQDYKFLLSEALQEIVITQPRILPSFSDDDSVWRPVKPSQSDESTWLHSSVREKDAEDLCLKHPHMGL